MSAKSNVTPPGPIPAGLIPLEDCPAALAASMGDGKLSRPVEIWRHNETAELRIEPDPHRLDAALNLYRDIVLDALRMGHMTALLLPDAAKALPASYWQWPEAKEAMTTGKWQANHLAVDAEEIRLLATVLDRAMTEREAAEDGDTSNTDGKEAATATEAPIRTGAPGRPSSMHYIGLKLEELIKAGKSWPSKANASRELEEWFKENYPSSQPPSAKTIKNKYGHKIPIARS